MKELAEERALPSGETGPRERAPLAREAAMRAGVMRTRAMGSGPRLAGGGVEEAVEAQEAIEGAVLDPEESLVRGTKAEAGAGEGVAAEGVDFLVLFDDGGLFLIDLGGADGGDLVRGAAKFPGLAGSEAGQERVVRGGWPELLKDRLAVGIESLGILAGEEDLKGEIGCLRRRGRLGRAAAAAAARRLSAGIESGVFHTREIEAQGNKGFRHNCAEVVEEWGKINRRNENRGGG